MMKKLVCFLVISLSGFALQADWITHQTTGLELWLPDEWDLEDDGNLLMVQQPDGDLLLIVLVSDAGTMEAFSEEMIGYLERYISDPVVTEQGEAIEVNGLEHYYVEGTGEYDGDPIDWDLTFVVGPRKGMVLIGLGDISSHQATLARIYRSIRLSE